jgi:hypothetical protein
MFAKQKCELFDALGWTLQCLLGVVGLLILVLKWRLEGPDRRPLFTFALDFTKQVTYSLVIHALNLMYASTMGGYVRKQDGPCTWYGMVQVLGVTLGLGITFCILKLGLYLRISGVKDSGNYGPNKKKPEMDTYCIQLWVWVAIVTVQRLSLFGLMYIFRSSLGKVGNLVFGPLKSDGRTMALVVMSVIPFMTSFIEFWIQDDLLMAAVTDSPSEKALHLEETADLLSETRGAENATSYGKDL